MENDDFAYLDDFLNQDSENNFNYLDLFEFVVKNKKFQMELMEFLVIESGFRECWNNNTGKLMGDGQYKNYVYRHIEKELDNKTIKNHIPQNIVDECVDLILDYLSSIGQYYSDFSKS